MEHTAPSSHLQTLSDAEEESWFRCCTEIDDVDPDFYQGWWSHSTELWEDVQEALEADADWHEAVWTGEHHDGH